MSATGRGEMVILWKAGSSGAGMMCSIADRRVSSLWIFELDSWVVQLNVGIQE